MKTILTTVTVLLSLASSAWATPIGPYNYNVAGDLSIVGNDGCTPSPCTETLNFSFRFAWEQAFEDAPTDLPILYLGVVVPGSSSVTSFGPLSPFRMYEGNLGNLPFYLPFGNGGDEIDLGVRPYTVTPWIAPGIGGAELYGCRTASCITSFVPPEYQIYGGTTRPRIRGSDSHVTVTAIPEPSSLLLVLLAGIGMACAVAAARLR